MVVFWWKMNIWIEYDSDSIHKPMNMMLLLQYVSKISFVNFFPMDWRGIHHAFVHAYKYVVHVCVVLMTHSMRCVSKDSKRENPT